MTTFLEKKIQYLVSGNLLNSVLEVKARKELQSLIVIEHAGLEAWMLWVL